MIPQAEPGFELPDGIDPNFQEKIQGSGCRYVLGAVRTG